MVIETWLLISCVVEDEIAKSFSIRYRPILSRTIIPSQSCVITSSQVAWMRDGETVQWNVTTPTSHCQCEMMSDLNSYRTGPEHCVNNNKSYSRWSLSYKLNQSDIPCKYQKCLLENRCLQNHLWSATASPWYQLSIYIICFKMLKIEGTRDSKYSNIPNVLGWDLTLYWP